MKIFAVLFFCLLFCCCKNNKSKDEENENRTTTNKDSSSIYSENVSRWMNGAFNTNGRHYDFTVEQKWTNDSVHQTAFAITDTFLKNYRPVLRWSPDSINILDLGSYGLIALKDKAGNVDLQGGEPDTEVALIDLHKKTRTRLIFAGPSANIIDGKWLSKEEALVLGTFLNEDQTVDTLMWQVDLKASSFTLYNIASK